MRLLFWRQAGAAAIALSALWCSGVEAARTHATKHRSPTTSHQRPAAMTSGYYVDFLARPTQYFGHSYIQIGSVDRDGRGHPAATVGFYPKTVKTVFNAPGFVGATARDLKAKPSVRYRVAVSERTYRKTAAMFGALPRAWRRYDLVGRNCNHMVGHVAGRLGLAVPGEPSDLPESYVRAMQAANGGRSRASWR